jgi:hypothetical protein
MIVQLYGLPEILLILNKVDAILRDLKYNAGAPILVHYYPALVV